MQGYRRLDGRMQSPHAVHGDQAWPMTDSAVACKRSLAFRQREGVEELINRRIGFNERSTIYVLRPTSMRRRHTPASRTTVIPCFGMRSGWSTRATGRAVLDRRPGRGEAISPLGHWSPKPGYP